MIKVFVTIFLCAALLLPRSGTCNLFECMSFRDRSISDNEANLVLDVILSKKISDHNSLIELITARPWIFNILKNSLIAQIDSNLNLDILKRWRIIYKSTSLVKKIDLLILLKHDDIDFKKIAVLWSTSIYDNEFEQYILDYHIKEFAHDILEEKIILLIKAGKYNIAEKLINKLKDTKQNVFNNLIDAYKCKVTFKEKINKKIFEMANYANILCLFKKHESVMAVHKLKEFIKQNNDYDKCYFAKLQRIAARAIMKKRPLEALRFLDNKPYYSINSAIDDIFFSGFISFNYLKNYKLAASYFNNMLSKASTLDSKSHATYWLARSYRALGMNKKATELFRNAALSYPMYFYGQMSYRELGQKMSIKRLIALRNESTSKSNVNKPLSVQQVDIILLSNILLNNGLFNEACILLDMIASKRDSIRELNDLMICMSKSGNIYNPLLVILSKQFANYGRGFFKEGYPIQVLHEVNKSDLLFILAFIRQESGFVEGAKSNAGALGIMQVLPITALKFGMDFNLLEGPNSIKAGYFYVNYLLGIFNRNKILTIAAYNAGERAVNRWLKINGDVTKYKNIHSIINWIEAITYSETRSYVKKVLENYTIYKLLSGINADEF